MLNMNSLDILTVATKQPFLTVVILILTWPRQLLNWCRLICVGLYSIILRVFRIEILNTFVGELTNADITG